MKLRRQKGGHERPARCRWQPDKVTTYRRELNQLITTQPDDINNKVSAINKAILNAASNMEIVLRANLNKKTNNHPWFDNEHVDAKKVVIASFNANCMYSSPENQAI